MCARSSAHTCSIYLANFCLLPLYAWANASPGIQASPSTLPSCPVQRREMLPCPLYRLRCQHVMICTIYSRFERQM
ncbi:hypothetical protein F4778DRAFT_639014 [Xylariomycetidae sp. FL2044]|nr:hypothetical protein F4778DRAFT_639014 [Xylariomycetidae sp. FL2044]